MIISIGIKTLADAYEWGGENYEWETPDIKKGKIIDVKQFAEDVVYEMERDDEEGNSPLTTFLENTSCEAVEQGSIAIEYESEKRENEK